jgi:hypothetical protein
MWCRDSVAALKRLLREVFADQLTIKQRLSDAEKAATVAGQLEAADDYQLQQAVGGSSSWGRAPVRMSGHITAAGVLPWSQVGTMIEWSCGAISRTIVSSAESLRSQAWGCADVHAYGTIIEFTVLSQMLQAEENPWPQAQMLACADFDVSCVVQESDGPGALAMLSGLGVGGAADARLQLHSVLAGGKRRITAEFNQAAQQGAAAALKLQAVRSTP